MSFFSFFWLSVSQAPFEKWYREREEEEEELGDAPQEPYFSSRKDSYGQGKQNILTELHPLQQHTLPLRRYIYAN